MKFLSEFREKNLIDALLRRIRSSELKKMKIMEVCGSQTHSIMKYNIEELLPDEISLVHGPGCPVCVTPAEMIDKALKLGGMEKNIVLTYGDMMRVPGSYKSLADLKSDGADIRIIYSPLDAVKAASVEKEKNVILFAIGFETTAPANASTLLAAAEAGLDNFFILSAQVLIPPAVEHILSSDNIKLDGLLAPGHVCSITGYEWCEKISDKYKIPVTVTGFEPADILEGIIITAENINKCNPQTVNQYRRIVKRNGNTKAQETINKVFCIEGRNWRGLGFIPGSGYRLNDDYSRFDA
ncbi:MAG: hydrogenase formation protein HypD, partial [Ignavibacteriales bacterium]